MKRYYVGVDEENRGLDNIIDCGNDLSEAKRVFIEQAEYFPYFITLRVNNNTLWNEGNECWDYGDDEDNLFSIFSEDFEDDDTFFEMHYLKKADEVFEVQD